MLVLVVCDSCVLALSVRHMVVHRHFYTRGVVDEFVEKTLQT